MNGTAPHIDPMQSMFDALADRVADKLEARLRPLVASQPIDLLDTAGLELMRVYSVKEAARLLGTNRIESVYAIPEDELPRVKRIGSRIGFLGINLLCYMHQVPPVDMQAAIEAFRERIINERPTIKPIHPSKPGLTRVQ